MAALMIVRWMRMMKKFTAKAFCAVCFVALALAFGISSRAQTDRAENPANNYINWGKKYYITIPDDWRQIDRFNVENFLRLHDKDPEQVDFDVFLCPAAAVPFYSQAYVFISAEEVENSVSIADSIQVGMAREFDKLIDETARTGPISRVKSGKPVYDKSTQTITQVSEVNAQGQNQIMTLVMKFYDFGIATFYFYTTEDKYESFKEKFKEIADSFSDEDLEKASGGAKPKIVDVSDINSTTNPPVSLEEKKSFFGGPAPWAVLISLVVVVLIARRKRR